MAHGNRKRTNNNDHPENDLELFARCASGFEKALAQELKALHMAQVRPLHGGVSFHGSLRDAYRACLWSRVATRIQLVIARVAASNADALYRGTKDVAWEQHVPVRATIAVDAHGTNPQLRNTAFAALKVKDALCDRLRDKRGVRPNVNAKQPDLWINVAIHQQKATLYLNLSGESLHRRGYRQDGVQTEAPLKETLAAGILLASDWPALAAQGATFADPMCGSGTLAIEAALIACNIAPGTWRKRWGFQGWKLHDEKAWAKVLQEAEAARLPESPSIIVAGDIDPEALRIAKENARRANVGNHICFYTGDASLLPRQLEHAHASTQGGLVAVNPPYGERMFQKNDLASTYASLATAVGNLPSGWQLSVLTPDAGIDTSLGRVPRSVTPCLNGPIETTIRRYDLASSPLMHDVISLAGVQKSVPLSEPHSSQLAGRLRKVAKERMRWARREGIDCFRIYDADLPEYAYAIDLYRTTVDAQPIVHLTQYRQPSASAHDVTAHRMADTVALVSAILDIPTYKIYVKTPQDAQTRTKARQQTSTCLAETNGIVCPFNPLDPHKSLPLEQRDIWQLVKSLAGDRRVAGLFSTSWIALGCATQANPQSITTVDASKRHLAELRELMRTNNISRKAIQEACIDPRAWLRQEERAHHAFDLIVCIPPEWISAREASGNEWELSRDGKSFLIRAARLLSPHGTLVYAQSNERPAVDVPSLASTTLDVEDVSEAVTPRDFARSRQRMQCFLLHRK